MKNDFSVTTESSLEAREKAQWIAFAPVVFQVAHTMNRTGLLRCLSEHGALTAEDAATHTGLPLYGTCVLLEAGLGIGLVTQEAQRFSLTKTGYFVMCDTLTRVNMNFVHDVCYQGLFSLEDSIRHGAPQGLKTFGGWPTVYEGLSELPPDVQKSWLDFDHYYSDKAFPAALDIVFSSRPVRKLLDIGGNTGRWARACLEFDPAVRVTILDLPGQIALARQKNEALLATSRLDFIGADMLDNSQPLPRGYDALWMSQFLDCFSEDDIVAILRRCRDALDADGAVYILEPFWDRQKFKAAAFCLQQTSLYFTAIANGTSRMYSAAVFHRCIERAGLAVVQETDHLGIGHTLLQCRKC